MFARGEGVKFGCMVFENEKKYVMILLGGKSRIATKETVALLERVRGEICQSKVF